MNLAQVNLDGDRKVVAFLQGDIENFASDEDEARAEIVCCLVLDVASVNFLFFDCLIPAALLWRFAFLLWPHIFLPTLSSLLRCELCLRGLQGAKHGQFEITRCLRSHFLS